MPAASLRRRPPQDPSGWKAWAFVRLAVSGLPLNVDTLEIYESLKQYGNISRITIFETRDGHRSTRAEVTFEPPPSEPFWHYDVTFRDKLGRARYIDLAVSEKQRSNFTVSSPVREGVKYNERTELLCTSIDFGTLDTRSSMMIFESRGHEQKHTKLVLDLHRREIEVSFPSIFTSDRKVATRRYRFMIAMDDTFGIWHVGKNSYVLHLTSPPWYSKQLREKLAHTHAAEGRVWSIEDTWARQTDFFGHKNDMKVIMDAPVSLQKTCNTINIARWTTFRLNLQRTAENESANSIFLNILRDFNIQVRDGTSFKFSTASASLRDECWSLLNDMPVNSDLTLHQQFSRTKMPFSVRYQLEVCLSHGWLSEYSITQDFLDKLAHWPEARAKQALLYVDSFQTRLFDPMEIFDDIRFSKPTRPKRLPDHCAEIHSATVTASTIIFNAPTVELSNRIIRKYKQYSHRFLRVRFEDDNYRGQTRLYPTSNNKMIMIYQRVRRTLEHGIRLADVHYEFLAWGNSQLREHSAYFFARAGSISADSIRADMGDFEAEKVVAKRAARMGQCFSTTKPVFLKLPPVTKFTTMPDIEHAGYNFSDGVGKISDLAARMVSQQLHIKHGHPSVFQFRRGGCKGVLAVAPELKGMDVKVRRSQFKFDSTNEELEIIRWSEYWQPYLNRQLILCLSSLGVPDAVFLRKQEQTIAALDAAMIDDDSAVKALRENVDPNLMALNICDLVEAGFRASGEPFVSAVLMLWRSWALKYLKEKAKIPVAKGAFVLGTVDETGVLQGHRNGNKSRNANNTDVDTTSQLNELPEIFIQIKDPRTGVRKVIEGVCVLARNPSLHRGDIRVVMARKVPALYHMCDVVVMPQNGDRDLPSMCSGGDLDGDDYVVFWDEELIPKEWNVKPFDYTAPVLKTREHITTKDMIDFFYDYMQNDCLGRIAHAHLGAADFFSDGLESSQCKDLVRLHSIAVDYAKTGVHAKMNRNLERNHWPHFMEKKGRSYHCRKILGQLYDAVQRVKFKPRYDLAFDSRLLNACNPPQDLVDAVQQLKLDYDNDLRRILAQHNIKTEFELWSTFVLNHSKASRDYKFHEEVGQLSKALKDQYYESLCDLAGGKDFKRLAPVAVAAYKHCSDQVQRANEQMQHDADRYQSHLMPFISFPWILQDVLIEIVKYARKECALLNGKIGVRDYQIALEKPEQSYCLKANGETPVDMLFSGTLDMFSGCMSDPLLQLGDLTRCLSVPNGTVLAEETSTISHREETVSVEASNPQDANLAQLQEDAQNSYDFRKPSSNGEVASINEQLSMTKLQEVGLILEGSGQAKASLGMNGFIPDEIFD